VEGAGTEKALMMVVMTKTPNTTAADMGGLATGLVPHICDLGSRWGFFTHGSTAVRNWGVIGDRTLLVGRIETTLPHELGTWLPKFEPILEVQSGGAVFVRLKTVFYSKKYYDRMNRNIYNSTLQEVAIYRHYDHMNFIYRASARPKFIRSTLSIKNQPRR